MTRRSRICREMQYVNATIIFAGTSRPSRKRCENHLQAFGYDLNTVEFAIKDGIPYAIDFMNPAPDAELASVGEYNHRWIVDA